MTKIKVFNSLISFILLLCLFSACQRKEGIEKGEKVPDFETTDLQGNKIKLSDYKGKVVMLYFWADFCPTCQREFPATQAYYEKLKGKDFELLAINVGEPAAASKKFREKYGATFQMLLDTTKKISETFGIRELPTNYFVTPDGKVARKITGFVGESQVKIMIEQNKLN
jgi:cytochrome c biogenesis protein CcmG/thiol:disulfide interchange protein DsbE